MLESGRYLQQKGFEILPLLPYIYFVGSSSGLIIMCKNIISNQSDFEKLGRLDSDRWWVFNLTVSINVYFLCVRSQESVLGERQGIQIHQKYSSEGSTTIVMEIKKHN